MKKMFLQTNVYEAAQKRIEYIFSEFKNINISFSGGKDSGLLLNLVLKYIKEHKCTNRICLFHQDFEAQYRKTTEYVERMFKKCAQEAENIELFWVCLPMAARTALTAEEIYWYPWEEEKKDMWVRPMPDFEYVINKKNNPFDFYKDKIPQNNLYMQFGRWYKNHCGGGKTITLLGLRADESLKRYSGIVYKKNPYKGNRWITKTFNDVYTASPLYDWMAEDIWIANAKFEFDYNELYDLFYKAGVSVKQMRVASPFNDWAVQSLNLYRVLEPDTWVKLIGRVKGVNFGAIYGQTKAVAYRNISLPDGHTWKSYTLFLLSTLQKNIRDGYLEKFKTSTKFWTKTEGSFSDEVIDKIEKCGYSIQRNGASRRTKDGKSKIIFDGEMPDNTDDIKGTTDIPSWKRMCICILKNDYLCQSMGFSPTKQQQKNIDTIKNKYKNIIKGEF